MPPRVEELGDGVAYLQLLESVHGEQVLHCCSTVVTLFLHCRYTVVALL
jgi:hypothetical protein